MAMRVVRVRPNRSDSRPKIMPPSGRPNNMATTTRAADDAAVVGPARTNMAGARAVKGRKTWILSIQLPTTPARRAARQAGRRSRRLDVDAGAAEGKRVIKI